MKRAITCTAALAIAPAAFGQFTYQHDDGTGGNAGPGAVGTPGLYVWGNVFDVAESGAENASEITTLLYAIGRVPAGASLTAMLFEDPNDDGNPDDGVLLASVEFVPTVTQSNTFTEIAIPPTIVSGRFYVACAGAVNGTSQTYLARTDFQTGQQYGTNSFFYWGPSLNPATLTGWSNRAQYTGVATAMVRAVGRPPSPACPADLGASGGEPGRDGLLDNNDFIAFINHFFSQSIEADLGSAGGEAGADGAWDNNDFIAFITLFFDGC